MVSTGGGGGNASVTDRRMSTVVPAQVTGDNRVHELSNVDLAMKLHYLRMVYYFAAGGAAAGLTVPELKYPMFRLLEAYYPVCGRIRRSDSGRPVIKCNDSGARVVEARCESTLDERLATGDHKDLAADYVIGPDVQFSPLVVVQFTRFKCGGLAMGFSWSHLLGDAVSAADFVNLYGQVLSNGNSPLKPHHLQNPPPAKTEKHAQTSPADSMEPLSVRPVETVGDRWLPPNELKMGAFSFLVTGTQLKRLQSKASSVGRRTPFQVISALIWQCLATIRGSSREPKVVTICKPNSSDTRSWIMGNEQVIGTVRADSSPSQVELSELASLIAGGFVDESGAIEARVETETGGPDLMVYGANLTFVDLQEDVDAYGFVVKGQRPVFVNFAVEGVGDEGAVFIFQGGAKAAGENGAGRTVDVILPEDQLWHLRKVLETDWGIA